MYEIIRVHNLSEISYNKVAIKFANYVKKIKKRFVYRILKLLIC